MATHALIMGNDAIYRFTGDTLLQIEVISGTNAFVNKILQFDANGNLNPVSAAAASIPNGDKGDITTSGSGAMWTIDSDAFTGDTWTPSFTNVANAGSISGIRARYTRSRAEVHGSLAVSVTPTSGTTLTQVGISLDIASNFADAGDACGTAVRRDGSVLTPGIIVADTTNDRMELSFVSVDTSAHIFYCTFGYTIIT